MMVRDVYELKGFNDDNIIKKKLAKVFAEKLISKKCSINSLYVSLRLYLNPGLRITPKVALIENLAF